MLPDNLLDIIRSGLAKDLPGSEAQFKMAPRGRRQESGNYSPPNDARKSAVLLLLYPGAEGIHMPMIVRQDYDGVHSGQVGLPGGKLEEVDRDYQDAALRETQEEIGIDRGDIEVWGSLSPLYIPPSNFWVQPFVGYVNYSPVFIPEPSEVAEILLPSFQSLMDPSIRTNKNISVRGNIRMDVPCFMLGDKIVWGATAMILSELVHLVEERM